MNINVIVKRMVVFSLFLAISAALLGAGAGGDGNGAWFEGKWTGQIQTQGGSVISVKLAVSPLAPGEVCARLTYGGSRSCTTSGTYEGKAGDRRVFSLLSQSGGTFCDRLDNLEAWKTASEEVSYKVSSRDGKVAEQGTLARTGQ